MKILQILILSSFLINLVSVRDVIAAEDTAGVMSVVVTSQTTLLYCTSMSFIVMKLVKNVYMAKTGMASTGQSAPSKKGAKKHSVSSSACNPFLLPCVAKLYKSITAAKTTDVSGDLSAFQFDRAASVKFDLVLWVHVTPMLIIFQFFMLPRGSIADSYLIISSVEFANKNTRLAV